MLGLTPDLPLNVDEARIRFVRDDLPLPTLLAATNLTVTVSGGGALPPGPNPVLGSRVRDLGITFLPDGQPHFSVDGLGFTVDLTGVIGDSLPLALGGELYIGGLNNPPNYLFAGKLKGNFKGNAVEGLVALDACGVRGVCFGLSGAEVNLSLGYGFVLTGARGGISFANVSNDPCSFVDQLPIDPITGKPTGASPCSLPEPPSCPPTITLADLGSSAALAPRAPAFVLSPEATATLADFRDPAATALHARATTPLFPCPTLGECPPASVNIQCMPHPENADLASPHANRIIYKFTSINEPLLNAVGITPESVAALVPDFGVDTRRLAIDLAGTLRTFIDSITPRAPADASPEVRALDAQLDTVLDQVELGFANALHCATKDLPANSQQLGALLYQAIRDTAYAGIPCQDLTLKLEGSVSYVGLASFANVTYEGLLSLPATSSQLSLEFLGSRLRLRFASGPTATVLGSPLGLNGGEATLDVATGGGFTGTFRTTSSPNRNLGFNLLGFQPSGTLTLGGIASSSDPQLSLAGSFTMSLAYPNPANPTQSLTVERNLAFDLEHGEDFSATVTSGLPSFDLGWLRVQRGDVGNVVVTRNGTSGAFGLAFNDWDIRLFGIDYHNQDFTVSTTGTLTRNLPGSTFNLGSGTGLLRLITGGVIPLEWVLNPAGTSAGRTFVDLPSTTSLSLTNVPFLSGTLRDGLAFGSALADIPATGIFDRTWAHTLTMNNLSFGSVSARLRRTTHNGPIEFTATRNNALWSGLSLRVSANTGSATSFAASLNGTFSVADWEFGSANFACDTGDPNAPFEGSAFITDPTGTVGLTLGIKLRGGAKPCLEFDFGGLRRTICQPWQPVQKAPVVS